MTTGMFKTSGLSLNIIQMRNWIGYISVFLTEHTLIF